MTGKQRTRIRLNTEEPEFFTPHPPVQKKQKTKAAEPFNSQEEQILRMHHTVGNDEVRRMILSGALQAKLRVGKPNDTYEQEADRTAEKIVHMPEPKDEPATSRLPRITPLVQKQPANPGKPTPAIESRIDALKGGGQPLSETLRSYFESRFRRDFSRVRVHTGSKAAQVAKDLDAKAFTTGNDIVFGSSQYSPGTMEGKRLIAHELTHTIQQQAGKKIQRGKYYIQRNVITWLNRELDQPLVDVETIREIIRNATAAEKLRVLANHGLMNRLERELASADLLDVLQLLDATLSMILHILLPGHRIDSAAIGYLFTIAEPWQRLDVLTDIALVQDLELAVGLETLTCILIQAPVDCETIIRQLDNAGLYVLDDLEVIKLLEYEIGLAEFIRILIDVGEDGGTIILQVEAAGYQVLYDLAAIRLLEAQTGLKELVDILYYDVLYDLEIIILQLESAGFEVDPRGRIEGVEWMAGHPLEVYGPYPRVNPFWTPGAADHAAAYTRTDSPPVDVVIGFDKLLVPITHIWVQATVWGAAPIEAEATISGTAADASFTLSLLPNSDMFGRQDYNIDWDTSTGVLLPWRTAGSSGIHRIYWLEDTPEWTLYSLAAEKATEYAVRHSDPATALRTGIRSEIGYEARDPFPTHHILDMYGGTPHGCADFANLLTALARAIGLKAKPRIYFGGFNQGGRMVWVRRTGTRYSIVNVSGSNAWEFHAISNINNVLHDAALNREGITGDAAHAGLSVRYLDLTAAAPPAGVSGTHYSHYLVRTPTPVEFQYKERDDLLTIASFGEKLITLPAGTTGIHDEPVTWSITHGSLPWFLRLDSATGRIHGTPFPLFALLAPVTYPFTVQVDGGSGATASRDLSITIT
jgi:hypothetical protein